MGYRDVEFRGHHEESFIAGLVGIDLRRPMLALSGGRKQTKPAFPRPLQQRVRARRGHVPPVQLRPNKPDMAAATSSSVTTGAANSAMPVRTLSEAVNGL